MVISIDFFYFPSYQSFKMNVSEATKKTADLFAKANDAFFDDDYDEALTLFTDLVKLEPENAEFLLKRFAMTCCWCTRAVIDSLYAW